MRRHGGMLVEVTIAAGLAAGAMIAVAQLLAVSAQHERAIEQRRLASQEAANALEQVMAQPWEEVTEEHLRRLTMTAASQPRLPAGRLACQIQLMEAQPPAKQIVAEVSWQNGAGDREQVRYTAWRFQAEQQP